MRYTIDPGRKRPSVNFIDSIVYSRRPDLEGNMLDLEMSIMLRNGSGTGYRRRLLRLAR